MVQYLPIVKYKLETAGYYYAQEDAEKLETLGFEFEPSKFRKELEQPYGQTVEIEISTMEELAEFVEQWGRIIVDRDTITIYDDYVE